MKKMLLVFLVFCLLTFCPAQDEGVLTVTASASAKEGERNPELARAQALRAAKLVAYAKMAKTLGLGGDGSQVFLRGAQVVSQRMLSPTEAEITMSIQVAEVLDLVRVRERKETESKLMSALAGELQKISLELDKLRRQVILLQQKLQAEAEAKQ